MTVAEAATVAGERRRSIRLRQVRHVYVVERRKLAAQLAVRLVAVVSVLSPFVFGGILKVQSGSPSDTLYGVWVHSSGFAVSLLLLAYAGAWGFPLAAGIVAGDLFSGEDRYGTWKWILTRSCTREEVFVGKLLAAGAFLVALVLLSAAASLLAGVLLIGGQPLVSLSGTLLSSGHSLALVLASWFVCIFPALALASFGVFCSIATRNGIVGVIAPGLAALAMQLLLIIGTGVDAHELLVGSAFITWHGLFPAHPYYGPLAIGILVSVLWAAGCLAVSWRILRRRDFAGTHVSRRPGWETPVRVGLALAAVIAAFAVAGNWGPAGVTRARLLASFIPTFNDLTLLQQREAGRHVGPGARLTILFPACSRRGSAPVGPGDWVCTFEVLANATGPAPPQQTEVSYDISVNSDGCYKAQSPPAFIGQQLMRDADGRYRVNPLYTIYGCFDPL